MSHSSTNAEVYLDDRVYSVTGTKHGGMGRVWLLKSVAEDAFDPIFRSQLAVKTFDNVTEQVDVERELNNWVALDHPSILPLLRIGRLNYRLAAMMPLMSCSIDDVLEQIGSLPIAQTLRIVHQIIQGLEYAYSQFKLLHLDLKPSNVLATGTSADCVKIADWGISRIARRGEETPPTVVRSPRRASLMTSYSAGTPLFMAPERYSGTWNLSLTSDIYSLGMMMMALVTGMLPYRMGSVNPIQEIITGQYLDNAGHLLSGCDSRVARMIMACIDPDPARRPQTYSALHRAMPHI